MTTNRIGVRLTPQERKAIDQLIESGKYPDITFFVRMAINSALKKNENIDSNLENSE